MSFSTPKYLNLGGMWQDVVSRGHIQSRGNGGILRNINSETS